MIHIPKSLVRKMDDFTLNHPDKVYKYYLERFKRTLEEDDRDLNATVMYMIKDTNVAIGIDKSIYLDMLDTMFEFFVNEEMYEEAGECRLLIDKFNIKFLLESTEE